MNTTHQISNQAELEKLITRYFEGETSLQEEHMLRDCLADCPWQGETIDEARFTLGYFTAHKHQSRTSVKSSNRFRIAAIAASIAVLLTVGVGTLWHNSQSDGECIAYINGKTIHNEKEVLSLMQNDLNEIGNATQSLADQLSSLGEAIETDI